MLFTKYSSGEGNGNPLQYSYLENPMDRGAWQAIVYGVTRVRHDLVTNPPHHHYHQILVAVCLLGSRTDGCSGSLQLGTIT